MFTTALPRRTSAPLAVLTALAALIGSLLVAAPASADHGEPSGYTKPDQTPTHCLAYNSEYGVLVPADCDDPQAPVPDLCLSQFAEFGYDVVTCPTDSDQVDPWGCVTKNISSTGSISWWGPLDCPTWDDDTTGEGHHEATLTFGSVAPLTPRQPNPLLIHVSSTGAPLDGKNVTVTVTDLGTGDTYPEQAVITDGSATIQVRPEFHRIRVTATYNEDPSYTSNTITATLKLRGSISATGLSRDGSRYIHAVTTPWFRTPVRLLTLRNGSWVTLRTTRTNTRGAITFRRLPKGRFRVIAPATADRTASRTQIIRLR